MVEPVVVTLSDRRNARKYQVTYDAAGQPRCVSVKTAQVALAWRAIWNFNYPLEGKALEAARAAELERRRAAEAAPAPSTDAAAKDASPA